jgi:hypothetical protein
MPIEYLLDFQKLKKTSGKFQPMLAVNHTQYMIEMEQSNHDNVSIRSQALKDKGAIIVGKNVTYGYSTALVLVP